MLNKDKPSRYADLTAGEWFTDAAGGIFLKGLPLPIGPLNADDVMPFIATNLISGMEKQFQATDTVYRQTDLKLSILFPNKHRK